MNAPGTGPATDLASAAVAQQVDAFADLVMRNPVNAAILERLGRLELPGCYLAAGALYQTIWNCLTGREPSAGIKDYDIAYFDATDLSADREHAVQECAVELFGDLGVTLDVRNQARVHLWYEGRFGVRCLPHTSTEAAVATFPSTSSAFAVRLRDGTLDICASCGFTDLFALRIRPNIALAPREVYEAKAARWKAQWPELEVIPWPRSR